MSDASDHPAHLGENTAPLALVAGGSRGLGLAAAHRLARRGHRLAICARDSNELERAAAQLRGAGATVETHVCDVTDEAAVDDLVAGLEENSGPVEVLLHVAGIIQVGPLASLRRADFRQAVDVMLWGPITTTLTVAPRMVARGRGRIGVVTSVGGLIAAPHLLPYSTAKFGATGFTRGLRSELAGTGVTVTTAAPGLMRTGSPTAALFTGDVGREYAWFTAADSIPLLSMDADRAAGRIVDAVLAGRAVVQPTPLALLAPRVDALAPRATSALLAAVTRLLPRAPEGSEGQEPVRGEIAEQQLTPRGRARLEKIIGLTRRAQRQLNEPS